MLYSPKGEVQHSLETSGVSFRSILRLGKLLQFATLKAGRNIKNKWSYLRLSIGYTTYWYNYRSCSALAEPVILRTA